MTEKEARHLLPQTIVTWEGKAYLLGTMRTVDCCRGVYIDWSDGQRGWLGFDRVKKLNLW